MILVIGGAYQGKHDYVKENYKNYNIIDNFHLTILELVKNNIIPLDYIKNKIDDYKDKVIICEDISCGVVPMDSTMRLWREELGRVVTFLGKESDEIVRVFCGIGTRIK